MATNESTARVPLTGRVTDRNADPLPQWQNLGERPSWLTDFRVITTHPPCALLHGSPTPPRTR